MTSTLPHYITMGSGPPLLLLHGYPQTHRMWHRVMPDLSKHFTCIAADLRGYGQSPKPPSAPDHAPYSKRAMAGDMVNLMDHLGHDDFLILAHDRGARVAHRLAADHPARVRAMTLLDIAPTREMYRDTGDKFARAYWHWFYLLQKAPFPENMIGADADAYMRYKIGEGSAGLGIFPPDVLQHYIDSFTPEVIHASCEDYRAAATIDIEHDDEGAMIECPLQVLWGAHGVIEACFDALPLWQERARQTVVGQSLPSGHYIAEEVPELLIDTALPFLQAHI